MLSLKDYSISRLYCRKKLWILIGLITKNTRGKSLKCQNKEVISIVKEANLEGIVQVIWEVIQTFSMRNNKWWNNNKCKSNNRCKWINNKCKRWTSRKSNKWMNKNRSSNLSNNNQKHKLRNLSKIKSLLLKLKPNLRPLKRKMMLNENNINKYWIASMIKSVEIHLNMNTNSLH